MSMGSVGKCIGVEECKVGEFGQMQESEGRSWSSYKA